MACVHCNQSELAFSRSVVLGEYGFELRKAVLKMKTDNAGFLAMNMSRLFLRERREQLLEWDAGVVIPVPMHFLRRFHRGVNSPLIFARELAETLGVPLGQSLIRRTRYTKPQFHLNEQQRRKNVKGAFALVGSPQKIKGKRILLVDDIMTTGATCHEIASVLKKSGADSVLAAVFARAEGKTYLKKLPTRPVEKKPDEMFIEFDGHF